MDSNFHLAACLEGSFRPRFWREVSEDTELGNPMIDVAALVLVVKRNRRVPVGQLQRSDRSDQDKYVFLIEFRSAMGGESRRRRTKLSEQHKKKCRPNASHKTRSAYNILLSAHQSLISLIDVAIIR